MVGAPVGAATPAAACGARAGARDAKGLGLTVAPGGMAAAWASAGPDGRGAGPRANGDTPPGGGAGRILLNDDSSAINVPPGAATRGPFAILAHGGPRHREESAGSEQIRQLSQRFGQPRAMPGEGFAVHQ